MNIPDVMEYEDAKALADKSENMELKRVSSFSNRWPNDRTKVGARMAGQTVLSITRMKSDGKQFALIEHAQ